MHATPFGQRQNSTHFTNYEEIVTFANVKLLMTYKCIIKILIEFIQHIRKNESTKRHHENAQNWYENVTVPSSKYNDWRFSAIP